MIRRANIRDISYIGANMRDHDWAEIGCQLQPSISKSDAAMYCLNVSLDSTCWISYDRNDSPVAAFGFSPLHVPGVWQVWAFGTKHFRRAVPEITKFLMEDAVPAFIKNHDPRRLQVQVMRGHDIAQEWLRGLGFVYEGTLHKYGRNGEDFDVLAWTDQVAFWTFRENWFNRKTKQDEKDTTADVFWSAQTPEAAPGEHAGDPAAGNGECARAYSGSAGEGTGPSFQHYPYDPTW